MCIHVLSVSYKNAACFEFCIMIEEKNQHKSLIYVLILWFKKTNMTRNFSKELQQKHKFLEEYMYTHGLYYYEQKTDIDTCNHIKMTLNL